MLLDRLYYLFSLTDGSGHRFFTPYIFALSRRIHTHYSMPMGRRCDVDDIHLWKLNEFAIVAKSLYTGVFESIHGYLDMPLINITDGDRFGACILEVASTHAADADDPLSQVVAGSKKSFAQDVAGHN